MHLSKVISAVYRLGSILCDIRAVRKGPAAIVKRLGRKAVLREVGKIFRK